MTTRNNFGDIYELTDDKIFRYFQLVTSDMSLLNSDVIAIFEGEFGTQQSLEKVTNQPIDFYLHTTVKAGVPDFWQKIGHGQIVDCDKALFKGPDNDFELGQPKDGMVDHWVVWNVNGKYKKVGSYDNVGFIFSPRAVSRLIMLGEIEHPFFGVTR
jgi:hypothetical protein